jgi:hypothetical protein
LENVIIWFLKSEISWPKAIQFRSPYYNIYFHFFNEWGTPKIYKIFFALQQIFKRKSCDEKNRLNATTKKAFVVLVLHFFIA